MYANNHAPLEVYLFMMINMVNSGAFVPRFRQFKVRNLSRVSHF